MNLQNITLAISGMSCGHCSRYVTNTLTELEGIISAEVSHETGAAKVEYDAEKISSEAIVTAINETHYSVVGLN